MIRTIAAAVFALLTVTAPAYAANLIIGAPGEAGAVQPVKDRWG
jgi:hypothetical protein